MVIEVEIRKTHNAMVTSRGAKGERDLGRWRAGCSCGWVGPAYPTHAEAELACKSHLGNTPVTDADPGRYVVGLTAFGGAVRWKDIPL